MKACRFFYSPSGCTCGIELMFGKYILISDAEIFYQYFFTVMCDYTLVHSFSSPFLLFILRILSFIHNPNCNYNKALNKTQLKLKKYT